MKWEKSEKIGTNPRIIGTTDLYPNFWVFGLNHNTVRTWNVRVCVLVPVTDSAANILLRNNKTIAAKKVHVLLFSWFFFDLNRCFDLWRNCLDMVGSCSCSRALEILRINCARVHVLSSYNITKQAIDCVVCVCVFFRSLEWRYQFSSSFRNFGSKDYWHEVLAKRVNKFFDQTIYQNIRDGSWRERASARTRAQQQKAPALSAQTVLHAFTQACCCIRRGSFHK